MPGSGFGPVCERGQDRIGPIAHIKLSQTNPFQ